MRPSERLRILLEATIGELDPDLLAQLDHLDNEVQAYQQEVREFQEKWREEECRSRRAKAEREGLQAQVLVLEREKRRREESDRWFRLTGRRMP